MARLTFTDLTTIVVAALVLHAGCRDRVDDNVATISGLVKASDYAGLVALLDSEDADLKCRAAKTLSWVRSPEAADAHVRLLSLEGCPWNLSVEAAWRLLEERAYDKTDKLVEQLSAKDRKMRWNIAKILGIMGDPDTRPALQTCLDDSDAFVRAWCGWAICQIDKTPDCAVPNMDLTEGKRGPWPDGASLDEVLKR